MSENVIKLDLSKPLRQKDSKAAFRFIGVTAASKVVVEDEHGAVLVMLPVSLENVPEPEKIAFTTAYLYEKEDGSRSISQFPMFGSAHVVSKALVSHTESGGWRIEEDTK